MSDTNVPYDPSAPEGESFGGSQYVTLKDARKYLIGFGLLAVLSYPVYTVLMGQSERHRCISNLRAIYQAINFYSGEHDNRFPPLARTEGDGITPSLSENGLPYTWVSDVSPYMSPRQNFRCPTALDSEIVVNESPQSSKATIPSAYGMYQPYGGVLIATVESPDQVVLVAETSNGGGHDTADPLPLTGLDGSKRPDGYVIGWSNSNVDIDKKTSFVTRLAFPGSGKGPTKEGRHGKFIQALSASGELLQLVPDDTQFHLAGAINPHWRIPPGYRGPSGG